MIKSSSSSASSISHARTLKINDREYVCPEERFSKCTQALQALDKVSEDDKLVSLRFHELPENLSRGIYKTGLKIKTCQRFSRDSEIIFNAEDSQHLGLVYEFTFSCSLSKKEKAILSLRFHSIHTKVWEIRLNEIVVGNAGPMSRDILFSYPDFVLFLLHSAVDILKMVCLYSSFHKKFTVTTIYEKRFIVFQYDKRAKSDGPIKQFLMEKCQWREVDKTFREENKILGVKKGSPLFSIPSQFFSS